MIALLTALVPVHAVNASISVTPTALSGWCEGRMRITSIVTGEPECDLGAADA